MRTNDFYNIIELVKRDVLVSEREYLKLLKVIGNNQRYDFLSQLSFYDKNPNATACASFDMWRERFNRTVMRGQKGIPILNDSNAFQKVGYIFDISQMVSMDRNVNEVELWSFDREKHENTLKDMIELQGYDSSDSLSENLYSLSRIYADESIYELANNLRIADEDRNSFVNFMRNSISFAISNRFNLDYPIPMDNLQENFKHLDRISLMSVGNCISNACGNIIEATMIRTRNLSVGRDLTKSIGADYNKLNENNNELGGMDNDSMSLLNDEFDYLIDELRENGQIKDNVAIEKEDNDLVNIVGNIVGEVETIERENKNGEAFKVVNFSIVSKDDEGNKIYTICSAYGDKGDIPKNFKQGDFVKLFGQVRSSIDDNGKEHTNVRILSSKLLKAKEQMKKQEEKKESVLGAIKKYKAEEKAKPVEKKESSKETER